MAHTLTASRTRTHFHLLLLFAFAATALSPTAFAQEIPPSLRDIVLAARQRPIVETRLDGMPFHGLAPFSRTPYLLWPVGDAGVVYDHDDAAAWIRRASADLGHEGFEPRYLETTAWRGNEVWTYELVHRGIVLHDAEVRLHWKDQHLVGLVNAVSLPILSIEDPTAAAGSSDEVVYTPRQEQAGFALRLARVQREVEGDRMRVLLVVGNETVRRIVEPLRTSAAPAATMQEWAVPQGTYPDQIDIDSSGVVWFSQPFDNWVTSFDPATQVFTQHTTTGGTTPDGMMVDQNDILWTGLYDSGGLGKLDIASSVFTAIGAPYSPVAAAVPNETTGGTVWITDHQNNRISEFDPASGTWLQSLVMPLPGCWVVGGTEDPASLDVYFTEYQVDRLGRKIFGGAVVDIVAPPGSGPAFAAHSNGVIYFSEWNQDRLGAYEIASGIVTEYAYPVAGETGGPIDATPGGLIAVGTRNLGYIMVFDPATSSFDPYPIPTVLSGLKDGLRSDEDGTIWFTETSANKLGALTLAPTAPGAQFSGTPVAGYAPLTVDFTDLSSSSPTTWSWDFGDSGSSSLPSPSHEYLDPGLYTVSLTAGNAIGSDVETKVDYVLVTTPCPIAAFDLQIAGKRVALDVVFSWAANADCQWDVHRATVPQNLFDTPPVATLIPPFYRDHAPPEPLVFYGVVPKNK